jgi:hypothetical protein
VDIGITYRSHSSLSVGGSQEYDSGTADFFKHSLDLQFFIYQSRRRDEAVAETEATRKAGGSRENTTYPGWATKEASFAGARVGGEMQATQMPSNMAAKDRDRQLLELQVEVKMETSGAQASEFGLRRETMKLKEELQRMTTTIKLMKKDGFIPSSASSASNLDSELTTEEAGCKGKFEFWSSYNLPSLYERFPEPYKKLVDCHVATHYRSNINTNPEAIAKARRIATLGVGTLLGACEVHFSELRKYLGLLNSTMSNFRKAGTRLGLLADNDEDIQEILDANGSVRQVLNSERTRVRHYQLLLTTTLKWEYHGRHGDYIPKTTICLYDDKIKFSTFTKAQQQRKHLTPGDTTPYLFTEENEGN